MAAIDQVMALYFVFNIMYPEKASLSLEFIQRYFYQILPHSTRGKKKNILSLNKVSTFIEKINSLQEDN